MKLNVSVTAGEEETDRFSSGGSGRPIQDTDILLRTIALLRQVRDWAVF